MRAPPLPSATAERLAHFNSDRGVWRAALHAVSLLVNALPALPSADAAHHREGHALQVPQLGAAELRAAFDAIDRDGDGAIDEEELRRVVRSLGAAEDEVEAVVGATLRACAAARGDGGAAGRRRAARHLV